MGTMVYLKGVVTLQFDLDRCIGCGMCMEVCPHAVFSVAGNRVQVVNRDACMECGACAQNCPAEALHVEAGVGCAAAVINSILGRESSSCCCVIEPKSKERPGFSGGGKSGCC